MSNKSSPGWDKVAEYFRVLQERIIDPITRLDIGRSCTATLLLLFAGVDGLGMLIHRKDRAPTNERILGFLEYMGGDYAKRKSELYELRKGLVHEAMNVSCYMSQAEMEMGEKHHLKEIGYAGVVYVNTRLMFEDFKKAFSRLRKDMEENDKLFRRADRRLQWREDEVEERHDSGLAVTLPPPVTFRYLHSRWGPKGDDE